MIRSQRGFTLIELTISIALTSVIALGALMVTHQTFVINDKTEKKLTPISQVESAAYWITRDAQMAESIVTDYLAADDFIFMAWTEWGLDMPSVRHTVTYYFDDYSNGIGDLMRVHWSSAGANTTTLVARNIHHKTGNPVIVSSASYTNPTLTMRLACSMGGIVEVRDYTILRRPDFNW